MPFFVKDYAISKWPTVYIYTDEASGGAYDWAKGVAGIKYSYTYELRPDGNSWSGFVVSEKEIQPSGEEIWASLAQVAEDLRTAD